MPMKSLFSLYPQLMTCPLALVCWRPEDRPVCWDIVEWVGVVCARPSRVSFTLTDDPQTRDGLTQAVFFSISLPQDDRLCRLRQAVDLAGRCACDPLPEGLAFLQENSSGAISLADCPVTFFCALDDLRSNHERLLVNGIVRSVQIQGRIYDVEHATDICSLDPFNARWFKGGESSLKTVF